MSHPVPGSPTIAAIVAHAAACLGAAAEPLPSTRVELADGPWDVIPSATRGCLPQH